MYRILVLYLSKYGQTKAIANRIVDILVQDKGIICEVKDLTALPANFQITDYQGVIIGASIYYGHFSKRLYQFSNQYAYFLNKIPSAFFSVNLVARSLDKCSPKSNVYTRRFLQKSAWHPKLCQVFAGALYYPRYGCLDRTIIRLIMKFTGGETDIKKEIEYTSWQDVNNFTEKFWLLLAAV